MSFDPNYKCGENLSILREAKSWFKEYKSIDIIDYRFTTDKAKEIKTNIDDGDLKKCKICKEDLYELDEETQYGESNNIVIVQKRHMLFISKSGDEYPTCYRLAHCYKRADKPVHGSSDLTLDSEVNVENINFERIVNNPSRFNDMFLVGANEDFNKQVKPFLKKWIHEPIDKKNVNKFVNDFQSVQNYAKKYCNKPPRLEDEFKERVLKIVGVHV